MQPRGRIGRWLKALALNVEMASPKAKSWSWVACNRFVAHCNSFTSIAIAPIPVPRPVPWWPKNWQALAIYLLAEVHFRLSHSIEDSKAFPVGRKGATGAV